MAELLEELLDRCRSGDREAVDALVRRFHSYAMTLALNMLKDHHAAEDAVQGAFIVVLERLDDLRTPAAFPGWLRQIVRTQAHRIIRRASPPGPEAAACAREAAPSRRVEDEELSRVVRAAVAALPKPAREAAELYYLNELDHYRVAEALDVPTGTVKRRLHDARRALRDGLADYGPDDRLPL